MDGPVFPQQGYRIKLYYKHGQMHENTGKTVVKGEEIPQNTDGYPHVINILWISALSFSQRL